MIKFVYVASLKKRDEYNKFLKKIELDYPIEEYDKEKAYSLSDTYFLIIGGDGTLNYFVSQFHFDFKPNVIYIPLGTANDFSKSVLPNIPQLESIDISRILKRDTAINVPIMKLNDKRFINVATCGAPAEVTQEADSGMKQTIGQVSYYLAGFKKFFTENVLSITVEIDGKFIDIETCGFVISQGLYAGGGIRVNPSFTACFGDDFSFLSTNDGKMFSSIQAISELTISNEVKVKDEIEMHFIKKLKIKSSSIIPVKLDGEYYESSELIFEKSDHSIKLFLY